MTIRQYSHKLRAVADAMWHNQIEIVDLWSRAVLDHWGIGGGPQGEIFRPNRPQSPSTPTKQTRRQLKSARSAAGLSSRNHLSAVPCWTDSTLGSTITKRRANQLFANKSCYSLQNPGWDCEESRVQLGTEHWNDLNNYFLRIRRVMQKQIRYLGGK